MINCKLSSPRRSIVSSKRGVCSSDTFTSYVEAVREQDRFGAALDTAASEQRERAALIGLRDTRLRRGVGIGILYRALCGLLNRYRGHQRDTVRPLFS